MVALAVCRGNLHRVSDAPRRWPIPPSSISLPQFKHLLRRRALALSRIAAAAAAAAEAAEENPRSPFACTKNSLKEEEEAEEAAAAAAAPEPEIGRADADARPSAAAPGAKSGEDAAAAAAAVEGKAVKQDLADPKLEVINDLKDIVKKEERKRELETKLHVLNEKKHNLVQMLKQILNAEEEVKRRSMQSSVPRPSMPLHVEVNFGGDSAGESDAAPSQSSHGRQLHQIHSTSSPSSASLNRPAFGSLQHNTINTSRGLGANLPASSATSNCPSGLLPTGQLGHAASLPPLSLPGAHFTASSPSTAGSGGGSSFFRNSRTSSS